MPRLLPEHSTRIAASPSVPMGKAMANTSTKLHKQWEERRTLSGSNDSVRHHRFRIILYLPLSPSPASPSYSGATFVRLLPAHRSPNPPVLHRGPISERMSAFHTGGSRKTSLWLSTLGIVGNVGKPMSLIRRCSPTPVLLGKKRIIFVSKIRYTASCGQM